MNDKKMLSIRELYRIGRGPSSSHTMGPERASLQMKKKYPDADGYRVMLYGSLAMTGEGHGTDRVIRETLSPLTGEVVFDRKTPTERHPNMMDFTLFKKGKELARERVWSIGGGAIFPDCEGCGEGIYPLSTFHDIARECAANNLRLWQYAEAIEGKELFPYLEKVWGAMKASINRGLSVRGVLPGGLGTERRAQIIYQIRLRRRGGKRGGRGDRDRADLRFFWRAPRRSSLYAGVARLFRRRDPSRACGGGRDRQYH